MKQSEIRKVVFITDSENLEEHPDYLEYIKTNHGEILSTQKCEEGFVCLVYFSHSEIVELDTISSQDQLESQ